MILVLATISLAIRRTGPASLGFHRVPRPGQMIITVFMLALAWTVIQFSLTLPILNHLTGQRQNLNQFAGLQGNLAMLLIFLALTWTLAAVGEETVYRGYIPTRIGEVFGQQRAGIVLGVAVSSALFALAHTEQGMIGVIVTFLDALFFSALRWRFRTLWAAVLAHGFNNTIGLVTFFFVGPIYGLVVTVDIATEGCARTPATRTGRLRGRAPNSGRCPPPNRSALWAWASSSCGSCSRPSASGRRRVRQCSSQDERRQ